MLSDNGKVLSNLISEFSQKYWAAGWLEDVEYIVWQAGTDRKGIPGLANNMAAIRMVELGKEFGIWVVWRDFASEPEEVPLEEWERIYERYMATNIHWQGI